MSRVQYWGRRVVPVLVLLLLVPAVDAGLNHGGGGVTDGPASERVSPANLTVVTTQGAEPWGGGMADGQLEGVRTGDGSVVFAHNEFERYYDVDPVDDRTLLFIAHERTDDGELTAYGVEWNWVTGETERRFELPYDTHDVDRVGPHRYVVADKVDHRAYVYNYTADDDPKRSTDEITWEYRFEEHFPPPPDAGEEGDYTHLNDVDVVDNGSTVVLDPRNFNRVVAVNRSTKEVAWTLGEQDNRSILFRQHDPVVIDDDPLTVLVGDSRNNRAVEYSRVDGRWRQTWAYSGELNWPRDVDRLPSGNTLVTDTGNDRVVEVAPNGTVVWQYNTTDPNPYDVERVHLGDEPKGPTAIEMRGGEAGVVGTETPNASIDRSPFKFVYRTGGWAMPFWIGPWEFASLSAATVLALCWVLFEGALVVRRFVVAW